MSIAGFKWETVRFSFIRCNNVRSRYIMEVHVVKYRTTLILFLSKNCTLIDNVSEEEIMMTTQKRKSVLLRISGYLVLLIQQIPPLGIYTGLMTLPVISNLALLFTNFDLTNLRNQIWPPFQQEWAVLGTVVAVVGFLLALYSIIYLGLHKKHGLVTTGPYHYIRHPQYTGFLLLTSALSGYSYWVLTNTFGSGWQLGSLSAKQTVLALWFLELGAYIVLARIEESYMFKAFGQEYLTYKDESSYFIPFGKIAKRYDIVVSIVVLGLILFILIIPSLSPYQPTFGTNLLWSLNDFYVNFALLWCKLSRKF